MITTEETDIKLTFKDWVDRLDAQTYLKLRLNAEGKLKKSGILYILNKLNYSYTPDEIFQDAWERMAQCYKHDESMYFSKQFYKYFWNNLDWAGRSAIEEANAAKRKLEGEGRLVDIDDPLADLEIDDEPIQSQPRTDAHEDELMNELYKNFIQSLPDKPSELRPICQVLIKNIVKDEGISQTEIALMFNISSSKVTRIKQEFQERMIDFIFSNSSMFNISNNDITKFEKLLKK